MTYLNRDSAQKLLDTRPQGTNVQDALKALADRGFTIEGYNDGSKGSINEPSILSKIGSTLGNIAEKRLGNIKQGLQEIPQAYKQETDSKLAGAVGAGLKLAQQPLNVAGQVVGAGFDIAEKGIGEVIPEKVKQDVGGDIKKLASSKLGQKITSDLSSDWENFKSSKLGQAIMSNPDLTRAIENTVNVASAYPIAEGAKTVVSAGKESLGTVIKDTSKTLSELSNPLKVNTSGISPEIMNRVARINPVDANKFKNLTGKSVGEYLTETGNFGSPDTIIKNEAEKYAKALNAKDTAIASLPGTYKNGAMEDLIAGIKEKALATSAGNVKSPYLKTAINLENKLQTEGLTMKEISDAIRLYEKEIKLGYNKTLNPEKVQLATNIDRAARTFQDETAKQLGFENLPELNKQIQTSRTIVDSLGKKIVSNDLLNGVSLTDYITLSGGNPASLGMFLTKKVFSNKSVQAKIAKMLANSATTPEIKAVLGETKFPRLTEGKTKIPTQDLPIKLQAKGKTQSQADINLQKSLKEKGTIPENSLISEAKKYKSAEEFVKAQPTVYHGTNTKFDVFDKSKIGEVTGVGDWGDGFYFSDNKDVAKSFAKDAGGDIVMEVSLKNLKFADGNKLEKLPEVQDILDDGMGFTDIGEYLKSKGYDGVKYKHKEGGGTEYVVYDADKIKTKSQLTDIWKKANKK